MTASRRSTSRSWRDGRSSAARSRHAGSAGADRAGRRGRPGHRPRHPVAGSVAHVHPPVTVRAHDRRSVVTVRTAVVEVGNTACRVVVAETAGGGWFDVVAERTVVLGLERAVRRDGQLGAGLLQLTAETLRRLREVAFRSGARQLVATVGAVLERAADAEELHALAAEALGTPLRVLDTQRTAQATVTAVRRRLGWTGPLAILEPTDHHLRLTVQADPGAAVGPSAGCLEVHEPAAGLRDLLPTGTVDPLHPAALGAFRHRLDAATEDLPRRPGGARWLVLAGPSAEVLGRAAAGRRFGDDPPHPDGLRLSAHALTELESELLRTSQTQRLLLPGVDPADVDLVAATLLAVRHVVERLEVDGVVVTTVGMLEGLLIQHLGLPPPQDLRDASIGAHGSPHGDHIAGLAGQLFDQLHDHLDVVLDADDRALLVAASRLHEVGGDDREAAAHRRGARQLLTAGLPGVGPTELVELASLVRFRTGRAPGGHFAPYGRLAARRRRALAALTGLLRLACGLDRGHDGAVLGVHVEVDPDLVCVHALGGEAAELDLALHGARAQIRVVGGLLGRPLVVRAAAVRGWSPVTA
ncbi:hypothetical protein FTX61_07085 [Nitriliruptoraceae bacterium ZYF776]|nr:hypothetical protein [Profundirhabdus halotolerans]